MKSLRNPHRQPTHPGAVLREDVLPALGWTQTELAIRLKVSRQTVSDLLLEKKSVTAEMAIRLARTVGGTPESWLRMQEALDLWAAQAKFKNNPSLAPKAPRTPRAIAA
jgi:addiction module HigA family antidote